MVSAQKGHGSSPRMWGTLLQIPARRSSRRFIPTHVGNTVFSHRQNPAVPVHPHACGEHALARSAVIRPPGSSPRMWGTRPCRVDRQERGRFIPTHVGNTTVRRWCPQPLSVHPHACGEHYCALLPDRLFLGSSPRMWGTLTACRWDSTIPRFIPTHVGNTAPATYILT